MFGQEGETPIPISQSVIAHSDGSVDIAIVVPFIVPGLPGACKASKPIIDQITASVATTGGSLAGGTSVYYHFTAVDSLGVESVPSEPIEVIIPSGTNTNKVTLLANNNPFDSNTSTFNVYRSLVAPTGDGTPANNPQQASSGNTPAASCAALTLTDTGSSISGGGGGAGSGNPPPSQLYIKTRVYYQLPSESIWRLGAETNDAAQTSLTFHLPHNIQGQQINIQLRNVFRNGHETPASLAPTKSYTISAAYPAALGVGAAPPAGSSFGVNGAKIVDNSGNPGLGSVPDDTGTSRFAVLSIDGNRRALIDFTQGGHLSKNLDNVADTASRVAIAATHASGNVAYNFKGAWSSAASYVIADEVTFGNIYWIALAANSNSQPSISNANWQAVGRIQGDVQIFTSSGTWNKPAAGTFAVVTVIGGGGGGQAGAYSTSGNAPGGWGGGPGGVSTQTLPLSVLGATESVTVGGAGIGGTGGTVTPGATGTSGGNSSFGNWLLAGGGFKGGPSATGATGAGNVSDASISMYPGSGGTGGTSNSTSASDGVQGASGATARVSPYAGGTGGAGNVSGAGGAGNPGTSASTDEPAGGGGGGGGGSTTSSSAAGGAGGVGGLYGAGGGGGGGSFGILSANSGSGGNGATGLVVVAVY